ncbi:uncharacterized protein LOC110448369 [Mizuhopecten yessoensis]|uniref:Toll-like receptor 6 n=1 Tax=Mizuhopecten yessoensis TaxID=6573 RepID=A0A210QTB0_MIZYE|nr:uncharacterized protein LOC110448369 [Mizuhopecten yessoensis]OWF51973.1 Toll-like receptor 6 [Mizuhopecten yessoensis]
MGVKIELLGIPSRNNKMAACLIPSVELPPGKEYHAYIVYKTNSKDSEIAFDIASNLESQYGLKCCVHDRDFLPGLAIVDNIDLFLKKSFKIVILLSEASLGSLWVEHELNVAIYLHLQKDNGLHQQIIPVKLDACTLPPKIGFIHPINIQYTPKQIWMGKLALTINCTAGLESLYGQGVKLLDCNNSQLKNGENDVQLSQESLCAVGTLVYDGEWVAKCFRVGDSYVITTASAAMQHERASTKKMDGHVEFPVTKSRNTEKFRLKSLKFVDEDLGVAVIKLEKKIFRRPPRRLRLSTGSESPENFTDVCLTCEMGSPCIVDENSTVLAMSLESGDGSKTVKAVKMEALKSALDLSDSHNLTKKLFE